MGKCLLQDEEGFLHVSPFLGTDLHFFVSHNHGSGKCFVLTGTLPKIDMSPKRETF